MKPTWRPLGTRLAILVNTHPDAIAAAVGLVVLVAAILAIEFNPAFHLVP